MFYPSGFRVDERRLQQTSLKWAMAIAISTCSVTIKAGIKCMKEADEKEVGYVT